jgi:2-amino-4-hydroxy-6-hydroxymethyldihydropteridine diphosphokinase
MSDQHTVYLALGTNVGERRENLEATLLQLPPNVAPTVVSRLYETAPAYVLDQPRFLNIAVKAQTTLSPADLLVYLKQLEEHIGRQTTVRYGPREIDIDIIFYDELVIELPNLQIPHPRLAERGFVLRPLADIGAELTHPTLKRTVAELTANLPADDGIIAVFDWQPLP